MKSNVAKIIVYWFLTTLVCIGIAELLYYMGVRV